MYTAAIGRYGFNFAGQAFSTKSHLIFANTPTSKRKADRDDKWYKPKHLRYSQSAMLQYEYHSGTFEGLEQRQSF